MRTLIINVKRRVMAVARVIPFTATQVLTTAAAQRMSSDQPKTAILAMVLSISSLLAVDITA